MDDLKKHWIGHLFYTMSSFVHHFKAIGEYTRAMFDQTPKYPRRPRNQYMSPSSKYIEA